MVCRDKERNFQQQRQQALQNIIRLIPVEPIERLQHHKALITPKGLFDMLHPGLDAFFQRVLLILDRVDTAIEGEQQEVHAKAHHQDRQAVVLKQHIAAAEYHFKKELQRRDEKLIESMAECGHDD